MFARVFLKILSWVFTVDPYRLNFTSSLSWWIGGSEFVSSSMIAFEFCFFKTSFFLLFYFILYFSGVSSFFYDLFSENEAGRPKIVERNLLVVASANSAKYSCCKAYSAVMRFAESYSSNL